MVGIARMRPDTNPTVTTLSQSFRAHRLLPKKSQEEYDNHGVRPERLTQPSATTSAMPNEQKKKEDDPFGSG
jgi:hypothetical protein